MAIRTITTAHALRTAIRGANVILVQPRLGVSEHWVKISKVEALKFVAALGDQTPADLELGSEFGEMSDGVLYLG